MPVSMDTISACPERAKRVEGSTVAETTPADERKPRKKHKKVRSAWIAFIGRIIAQFVGSAASIVLGLMLLHKYQPVATETAAAASEADKPLASATAVHRHDGENAVAVLPLRRFSSARVDADIADSMTDVVTAALADIPGVRVVSPSASSTRDESRAAALATELGVRYVLEGSVTHADDRFRVIVRVVDTERDEQVWASRYERPVRNMFRMQDEIAAALVRDLKNGLFDREDGPVPTTWATGTSRPLTNALPLLK
jgi:TolB-like protein